MILIIRTIQLFEHPPFPGKMIKYCIPCIQTPTFEIIIRTPTPCGAQTGVDKRLLAFDSLCGARARVTERLLAYYSCFRTSTRLLQSLWSSNGDSQTCTSL